MIEGHKWVIGYTLKEGFDSPGQLKVRQNYINAIKKIGGTILFDRGVYMKLEQEGKERSSSVDRKQQQHSQEGGNQEKGKTSL